MFERLIELFLFPIIVSPILMVIVVGYSIVGVGNVRRVARYTLLPCLALFSVLAYWILSVTF